MLDSIEIIKLDKGYSLKSELELEASIEKVFSFFSSAENLEVLTPDFLNFKILTPLPIVMKEGSLIDYSIRLHLVPIRWRTLISEWAPPSSFTDTQLRGPYSKWVHRHFFEARGSRTLVRDEVEYDFFGGDLAHKIFVKPNLLKIFSYRQSRMLEIFK